MILTGALVNGGAIVVGGLLGTFGGKLMPEKMRQTVLGATALVSMGIGISGAIGSSARGLPIWSVSIGEGETQVFYNAAHHANEWITTPVLLAFLEEYCLPCWMAIPSTATMPPSCSAAPPSPLSTWWIPMASISSPAT